tara:strand:- start:61 stop:1257 length:1197 start_codon:yes stop_codon:yes gene_type:complete
LHNRIIAVVDPLKGGHHEAFLELFCKAFLEMGFEVWVFSPMNTGSLLKNERLKASHANGLIKFEFYEDNLKTTKSFGRASRALDTLQKWRHLNRSIKAMEATSNTKVGLVYFAWLDSYLNNYLPGFFVDAFFSYRWSGLYFHPRHMRLEVQPQKASFSSVDGVLLARNCVNVAVHDPAICDNYKIRLGGKAVYDLPELSDNSKPTENHPVAVDIGKRAGGRTVVGMIGLAPHQGLQLFCNLAVACPSDEFFFAFIGSDPTDTLGAEKSDWLKVRYSDRENCFFHLRALQEGPEYNAVFNAMDIIWLVYPNFTSTSNRLTKAAYFRKPVLASGGFILGELVEKFGLGITLDDQNLENAVAALTLLSKDQLLEREADYEGYLALNSYRRFVEQLTLSTTR